jgi:hypothetical protein
MTAASVPETIAAMEARGYTGQFRVGSDGRVTCSVCGQARPSPDFTLVEMQRVEADSDPEDTAVVAGVECPCGARSTAAFAHGPSGDQQALAAVNEMRKPAGRSPTHRAAVRGTARRPRTVPPPDAPEPVRR